MNEITSSPLCWPKMDGSAGIKLIGMDGYSFENEDMNIEEVSK